jgi:transcriptional regulator with XRE-family HTH domain
MGERIGSLRRKRELSLGQFGKRVGISGKHLGLVEKGVRGLSVSAVGRICAAMGVSADYLLFGTAYGCDAADAVRGLSREQIEITLDSVRRVALFVNSDDGNEALIRELLRQQASCSLES